MPVLVPSPLALGRALRDARRRKGLTQKQVAELAAVGQPTVSNVERGVISVSLDTLVRILAALGLELALEERRSAPGASPWSEES
jgi:HTH-type transcriptional regulator / antitoxin HipB